MNTVAKEGLSAKVTSEQRQGTFHEAQHAAGYPAEAQTQWPGICSRSSQASGAPAERAAGQARRGGGWSQQGGEKLGSWRPWSLRKGLTWPERILSQDPPCCWDESRLQRAWLGVGRRHRGEGTEVSDPEQKGRRWWGAHGRGVGREGRDAPKLAFGLKTRRALSPFCAWCGHILVRLYDLLLPINVTHKFTWVRSHFSRNPDLINLMLFQTLQ